jgi:hypothetical protein
VSFSHGPNKLFWYLIHVELQKEMVTVQALTLQMTPLKTIRMIFVSAHFRQFGSFFELFDIVILAFQVLLIPQGCKNIFFKLKENKYQHLVLIDRKYMYLNILKHLCLKGQNRKFLYPIETIRYDWRLNKTCFCNL